MACESNRTVMSQQEVDQLGREIEAKRNVLEIFLERSLLNDGGWWLLCWSDLLRRLWRPLHGALRRLLLLRWTSDLLSHDHRRDSRSLVHRRRAQHHGHGHEARRVVSRFHREASWAPPETARLGQRAARGVTIYRPGSAFV